MIDRMWFAKAKNVAVGDMVWYYRTDVLIGPLLIIGSREGGYGFNKQTYWIMFDTTTGDYHQAAKMWLRVPRECS